MHHNGLYWLWHCILYGAGGPRRLLRGTRGNKDRFSMDAVGGRLGVGGGCVAASQGTTLLVHLPSSSMFISLCLTHVLYTHTYFWLSSHSSNKSQAPIHICCFLCWKPSAAHWNFNQVDRRQPGRNPIMGVHSQSVTVHITGTQLAYICTGTKYKCLHLPTQILRPKAGAALPEKELMLEQDFQTRKKMLEQG